MPDRANGARVALVSVPHFPLASSFCRGSVMLSGEYDEAAIIGDVTGQGRLKAARAGAGASFRVASARA